MRRNWYILISSALVGILTFSSSSRANLSLVDILAALHVVYEQDCKSEQDRNHPQCKLLKQHLRQYDSEEYRNSRLDLAPQLGKSQCATDPMALASALRVARDWASSLGFYGKYDFFSTLNAALCVQDKMETWIRECNSTPEKELKVTPSRCFIRVALKENPWFEDRDIEIRLKGQCKTTLVSIQEGEGNFKTAHREHHLEDKTTRIQLRFKPENYPSPNSIDTSELRKEIDFIRRLQGNPRIGLPEIFDANWTTIELEAYDGELGRVADPLRPFAEGGAEQGASQLLSALATTHAMKFSHRDIKPENILISGRQSKWPPPKLALWDFGMGIDLETHCKNNSRDGKALLSVPAPKVGTPYTRAPEGLLKFNGWNTENCLEQAELAKKADVFSMAMLIYRMVNAKKGRNGNIPWITNKGCDTLKTFVDCLEKEHPAFIKQLHEDGKKDPVYSLLARAMDLDPAKRPSSREFQLEFDHLMKQKIKNLSPSLAIRSDINDSNVHEALGNSAPIPPASKKYILYVETSPTEGIFELKAAYRDSKNNIVISRVEANPFDPKAVKKALKFLDSKNYVLVSGKTPTHPDTGPILGEPPPRRESLALPTVAQSPGQKRLSESELEATISYPLSVSAARDVLKNSQFPDGAYLITPSVADGSGRMTYIVHYKNKGKIEAEDTKILIAGDRQRAGLFEYLKTKGDFFKHPLLRDLKKQTPSLATSNQSSGSNLPLPLHQISENEAEAFLDSEENGSYIITPPQSPGNSYTLFIKDPYGYVRVQKLTPKNPNDASELRNLLNSLEGESLKQPVYLQQFEYYFRDFQDR